MKTRIFSIAAAAATLAGAGLFAGAALDGAQAQKRGQAPVILVVNMEQLVAQSKAGQTIPEQAEKVRANVVKELEGEASKLNKDIEDFEKNQSLMSEEVRQKTGQELAMRRQVALPQRAQIAEQAFRIAVQNAQGKILQESQPILKEIVDKRGATVLLDRAAVMYAATETDVTDEVIKELDKKMNSVEVQQVSLAEIEKQLREAQQAQAAAAKK